MIHDLFVCVMANSCHCGPVKGTELGSATSSFFESVKASLLSVKILYRGRLLRLQGISSGRW